MCGHVSSLKRRRNPFDSDTPGHFQLTDTFSIFIFMKIAFYRGNDIIGRTILFFSRGGYTHAAIVLNDGRIIEAYPSKGVRMRQDIADRMSNTTVDIFEIPTTPAQDEIIKDFLANQMGKKYDYIALIGFILYTTKEGRKQRGKWICSELVFVAFQKAGINLLERIEAWMVSPTIISYNTKMKFLATRKI